MDLSLIFLVLAAIIVGLYIVALPVKMAAAAMGADRTDTFSSLIALIVASVLHAIGLAVPVAGTIVAFLLSALAFAVVLGTGFFRGIGIAILHIVFTVILVFILTTVFGVSLAGIFSSLGY